MNSLGSVNYGVTQGSVLDPLLFSAYMNDLPEVFNFFRVKMYADVTVFYCSASRSNLAEQVEQANSELQLFSEWCRKNKITLNVDKPNVFFVPRI